MGTGQIEYAITKAGYRHIDCASIYGNEKEIGMAFKKIFSLKKIKREDIFITNKLWNTNHNSKNVEKACKETLKNLQLDYLDLYLIHWGIAFAPGKELYPVENDGSAKTEPVSIQETWMAMENLVKKGLVKSIGVSNFTTPMIVDLLTYARIKPVVNQIEIHPYNSQQDLVSFCQKKKIVVTAYSPLGSSKESKEKPISDKTIIKIAKFHKKTPAQILIKWCLQRGLVVIPKSVTPNRILENIDVDNFELSTREMELINKLNRDCRYIDPFLRWKIPYFK